MAKTKQLPGGRVWNEKTSGVMGWSSEDNDFDILVSNGYCVLVSFVHDPLPGDSSEFWRKRFDTVDEAMEHAEKM